MLKRHAGHLEKLTAGTPLAGMFQRQIETRRAEIMEAGND